MNKLIGAVITDIYIEDGVLLSIEIERDGIKNSITGGDDYDRPCLSVWEKTK